MNLKVQRGLAWSCKVYFQNKKVGLVSNSGTGGITDCHVPSEKDTLYRKRLKVKRLQAHVGFGRHEGIEPTEPWRMVCGCTQMVDEVARLRQLKRLVKTHLIIRQHSSENEFSFYSGSK